MSKLVVEIPTTVNYLLLNKTDDVVAFVFYIKLQLRPTTPTNF
ncbi:hypothetical protein DOY81_003366 [Sarcophaga bullata]|nr:hypothetical protein DOY81_003366 [Sarcophaga bullata]